MIRLIAELKCSYHPHYKAMRSPSGGCYICLNIWDTVQAIRRHSKRYTMQWSDKVWPRIGGNQ